LIDLIKHQKLWCPVRLNTLTVGDGTDTMSRNVFTLYNEAPLHPKRSNTFKHKLWMYAVWHVQCNLLCKTVLRNYIIEVTPIYVTTITQSPNLSLHKYLETCNPAVYTLTSPITKKQDW